MAATHPRSEILLVLFFSAFLVLVVMLHLQDLRRRRGPAHLISETLTTGRDIRGIGFRTADQIAASSASRHRADPCACRIAYAHHEAMTKGIAGYQSKRLISLTRTLLEVPADLVETALGHELETGAAIGIKPEGRRCVSLRGLSRAEREITEKFKALAWKRRSDEPTRPSLGRPRRSGSSPTAKDGLSPRSPSVFIASALTFR